MNKFRTLDDIDVKGKRVLLRVDLNVPMESGRVSDATRLERVAPTITEIPPRAARSSCSPISAGPRAATPRIRSGPSLPHWRRSSTSRSPSPTTASARPPPRPSPR